MMRRGIVLGAAPLAVASVCAGVFYSWTMAVGVFWFGASFLVLVFVMKSFSEDMPSRPDDPERLNPPG